MSLKLFRIKHPRCEWAYTSVHLDVNVRSITGDQRKSTDEISGITSATQESYFAFTSVLSLF